MNEKLPDNLFQSEQALAQLDGATKITLPPFIRPADFAIGAVLIGKIVSVQGDFTGREGMEDCQNLILETHAGEVMMPLTGVLLQSMLRVGSNPVGKTIAIKRLPDGQDKQFKNKMFMFDLWVVGVDSNGDSQELHARSKKLKNSVDAR